MVALLMLLTAVLQQPGPGKCVASAAFYDHPQLMAFGCAISWDVWPNDRVEADGIVYYPMLYNVSRVQATGLLPVEIEQIILEYGHQNTVLMLNECDVPTQCNMSPGQAATFVRWWRDYLDPSISIIVGGVIIHPDSVGGSGVTWMNKFINSYLTQTGGVWNLQGVHFHIYPDLSPFNPARNTSAAAIEDMKAGLNYLHNRGLPRYWEPGGKIFFSEIGCLTSGCASWSHMANYTTAIRTWLDTEHPGIAWRAFWYTDYSAGSQWWTRAQYSNGNLTPVGVAWSGN